MLELSSSVTAWQAGLIASAVGAAADFVEELLGAFPLVGRQLVTLVGGDKLQRRVALGGVELAVAVLVEDRQRHSLAGVELANLAAGAGRRGEGVDGDAVGEVLGVDRVKKGGDAHLVVGPFAPVHVPRRMGGVGGI